MNDLFRKLVLLFAPGQTETLNNADKAIYWLERQLEGGVA